VVPNARQLRGVSPLPFDNVVRADALRLFPEVVSDLGGDPLPLLERHHIDPERLDARDSLISYRAMIRLLEDAAAELRCPDFGLRLAARQGGVAVLGPLGVAMRNASTVGDAYRYCAAHLQVYSPAVRIELQPDPGGTRWKMRFDILLSRLRACGQAVENALCLTHHAVLLLSSGRFGAREVWFTHERRMPWSAYARYFEAPVRFGQSINAVFFNTVDLAQPIRESDPRLYEMASAFIDSRYPGTEGALAPRVRAMVQDVMSRGGPANLQVAGMLGMHVRTLQRRLRQEGTGFEELRDQVRRDLAERYLRDTSMPLSRVAVLLGYSESAVLTRSCRRWFSCSPRELRARGKRSRRVKSLSHGIKTSPRN
jgi:AraC-like DNA-binding protein